MRMMTDMNVEMGGCVTMVVKYEPCVDGVLWNCSEKVT